MDFRTIVDIPAAGFEIGPCEEMLFVGSCFAAEIGRRFRQEGFPATVNPYGTMYNPVSIVHTVERCERVPRVVFLTLGTNRIYRLRATGEVVDNCQKRPQNLFREETLSTDECREWLLKAVDTLRRRRPEVQVVLTVSPIRYRKYGYHESQLSKAALLLAANEVVASGQATYFPSYEIFLDELRDYRFYAPDMLHPSQQAVDYVWERLAEAWLSAEAKECLRQWQPLKRALGHRPLNPESEDYRRFREETEARLADFRRRWPGFAWDGQTE